MENGASLADLAGKSKRDTGSLAAKVIGAITALICFILVVSVLVAREPKDAQFFGGILALTSIVTLPISAGAGALIGWVMGKLFHQRAVWVASLFTVVALVVISGVALLTMISEQPKSSLQSTVETSSQAKTITECSTLYDQAGYWNGCVARFLKTKNDFDECLRQADASQLNLSWGVCGLTYALELKDVSICDQVGTSDNMDYCRGQYLLRSQAQ